MKKAPVSQRTRSSERREPAIHLQGTRGTTLFADPFRAQPLNTISFLQRIAAPVTVGIRQSLLQFQPCRSGASSRSSPHRLAPPGGSLQQKNTSFFPRQRIYACFKVNLLYQKSDLLSSSLTQMQNEENSTFDGKFRAGFIPRPAAPQTSGRSGGLSRSPAA